MSIGCLSNYPSGLTLEMEQRLAMRDFENTLERAVGRMSPEDQESFKNLANCHTQDGSGPLLGIVRTNGFGLGSLADGPDTPPGQETPAFAKYSGICKLGSRINHR